MLKNNPYLKERPVNIHLPGGVKMELPRNTLKGIGRGLQAFGIASAVISGVNDIDRYNRGEISGVHLTANLIMNGVGFLGPWEAAASIMYGFAENEIYGEK